MILRFIDSLLRERLIWCSWLPRRIRRKLAKQLIRKDYEHGIDTAKSSNNTLAFNTLINGIDYRGTLHDAIDFDIYFYGAFEKHLANFLIETALALRAKTAFAENKDAITFWDVGANSGQHSLLLSRYVETVHAFEPYPEIANLFENNISRNQLTNITLHRIGLGDRDTSLPFYAPRGSNRGIGSFDQESIAKGNQLAGDIAVRAGDGLDTLQKPTLIKIDVEGVEKSVLIGLKETLTCSRPVIVLEVSYGGEYSFASRLDLLACLPSDYRLFAFDRRHGDGRKARRRNARAKWNGLFSLKPFIGWREDSQDDLIACPEEFIAKLPMRNSHSVI